MSQQIFYLTEEMLSERKNPSSVSHTWNSASCSPCVPKQQQETQLLVRIDYLQKMHFNLAMLLNVGWSCVFGCMGAVSIYSKEFLN